MRIIKQLNSTLIAASLIGFASIANAEIAIIVNQDADISRATQSDVAQLFLGKRNEIDGEVARPIDQEEGSATRTEFYQKVIGKSGAQLNAYWSRLIFTGKGMPPDKVLDDAEVIEMVSDESDLVGYVNPSAVDESVKVILVIP